MNIFEMVSKFFTKPNNQSQSKQDRRKPKEDLVPFSPQASHNLPVSPDIGSTAQLESYRSWIYVAVTKLAQSVAEIELKLFESKGDNEPEEVKTHDAIDVLQDVNQFMTFYDLVELYQTYMELSGEAFWWLVKSDSGEVLQIYPYLRPDRMIVVSDSKEFIKGYVYVVPGTSTEVPFSTDEIVHFKTVNPLDPYRGYSTVKAGEAAVATDQVSSIWNWKFFKNNAKPYGIIESEQTITDDQYERIITQWDQNHKGEDNNYRISVLGGALKYKDAGFTQKDMDFANLKRWTRDEILALFKVPMGVINPDETITYANADAAKKVFQEMVIVPKMTKFVKALNEFYLPQFEGTEDMFFDYEDPVPENREQRNETNNSGINNGWLTQNEVRTKEGLDAVEGGDVLYLPSNLVPAGSENDPEKAKRNFMIKHNKRSENEKMEEKITKALKGKGSKLLKKNSKSQSEWELWGEKICNQRNNIIEKQANKFNTVLRSYFLKQWLERILPAYQSTGSLEFLKSDETELLISEVRPIIRKTLEESWDQSLQVIGQQRIFSDGFDNYIDDIGLKFASTVNNTTQEKLNKAIEKGTENEETPTEIIDRMNDVYRSATINRTKAIARTEIQRVANWTTLEAYKRSDVVVAKQWYTALDERVCPFCRPLHGKIVDVDSAFFDKGDEVIGSSGETLKLDYSSTVSPPLHPQCRCTLLPKTIKIN